MAQLSTQFLKPRTSKAILEYSAACLPPRPIHQYASQLDFQNLSISLDFSLSLSLIWHHQLLHTLICFHSHPPTPIRASNLQNRQRDFLKNINLMTWLLSLKSLLSFLWNQNKCQLPIITNKEPFPHLLSSHTAFLLFSEHAAYIFAMGFLAVSSAWTLLRPWFSHG